MAVSNGAAKTGNGHANGHLNGHANGKMNGNAVSRIQKTRRSRSLFGWLFNVVSRLITWSAILTILFRCPSSLEQCDDSSPVLCKPYFQAKNAVLPHVTPYYDQYAAPYVEIAKPYYDTVDSTVIAPVRQRAVQYGAPWVEKGQTYAVAQWKKTGEPQLALLQDQARTHYEQSIAPYLDKAGEAVGPYYTIASDNVAQTYNKLLLPGYEFAQPYAVQGYDASRDFTTGTALPAVYWAWNKTYVFLDTSVWPQLRVTYVENVEPQLVRIGERLGRYKTAAKGKTSQEKLTISSVFDAAQSSFAKVPSQSTAATTNTPEATAVAQTGADFEENWNPVEAPAAADNESEKRTSAREMVAEDLASWQKKFTAHAEEGAADMDERVDEIANRMIAEHAQTTGKKLLEGLESTVKQEIADLKTKIASIAESSDDDVSKSEDEVVQSIRSAGVAIREQAQGIRAWREQYDEALQNTVVSAADVHFQILDETRSLALQQIGMKWAWADDVTYKDWAKYHELKSKLTEWTDDLKQHIVTHPTLLQAQDAAAQIEDEGMGIASEAAKELVHLKEVGRYKIIAKDSTDIFDIAPLKAAAEAAQSAKQAVREAARLAAEEAAKAKDTVSEKLSEVASSATDAYQSGSSSASSAGASIVGNAEEATSAVASTASEASDAVSEQSTAASQSVSSVLSEGVDAISEAGEELSSTATDTSSTASSAAEGIAGVVSAGKDTIVSIAEEVTSTVVDVASAASGTASAASSQATDAASGTTSAAVEEIKEASSSLASVASASLVGDTEPIVGNATEQWVPPAQDDDSIQVEEDPMTAREETPPLDTPSVKPAFLGAAAQEVPARQVILDDYVDTDSVASATNAAAEAYSNAVSKASEHYSSAVSVVSAQIYGTPKPVHEQLLSSVSGAYDNALAAASSRFNYAVEAASTAVQSTPTATPNPLLDWHKAEAVAAQRLNEGRLWAELQYSSALIAVGLATPTPTAVPDKFYEQAKLNYYAGLGLAQERYSSFLSAASSAFSSITATPTPTDYAGSASSMASVAKESAASVVNAAGDAAGAAYNAATDTVASAAGAIDETIGNVIDGASEQLYIAGAAVAERWDNVIGEISGRVYGDQKQLSWYENIVNEAGSYASAATEAVVGGASSATEAAGDSAAAASAEAAKQYSAVSDLVSELLVGKEPTFSESVLARLSAAYSTAAANVESLASEASAAASSVGDKVGSAAGKATDVVKETVQHAKDEL